MFRSLMFPLPVVLWPSYLSRVEKQAELDVIAMEKLRKGEKHVVDRPDTSYRQPRGFMELPEQYVAAKHSPAKH